MAKVVFFFIYKEHKFGPGNMQIKNRWIFIYSFKVGGRGQVICVFCVSLLEDNKLIERIFFSRKEKQT